MRSSFLPSQKGLASVVPKILSTGAFWEECTCHNAVTAQGLHGGRLSAASGACGSQRSDLHPPSSPANGPNTRAHALHGKRRRVLLRSACSTPGRMPVMSTPSWCTMRAAELLAGVVCCYCAARVLPMRPLLCIECADSRHHSCVAAATAAGAHRSTRSARGRRASSASASRHSSSSRSPSSRSPSPALLRPGSPWSASLDHPRHLPEAGARLLRAP